MSTVESIKYCGGISSVLWRVLNSVEGYLVTGGCVVQWRDMSTIVGYHQDNGGYS